MFKWWIMWAQNKSYNSSYLAKLRDAAMISIPSSDEKSEAIVVRSLGGFKTIFNPKTISPDLPLPPDTLPFELSRSFQLVELELVFEFSELKLVDWAKFITSAALVGEGAPATTNILVSSEFAEKVSLVIPIMLIRKRTHPSLLCSCRSCTLLLEVGPHFLKHDKP